ncbi:MAG: GNAT family N-acetyltransferase [Qipengyuania sp.]|nr:GNAT family N-acetyltransferase [Qipengyuania sp.]
MNVIMTPVAADGLPELAASLAPEGLPTSDLAEPGRTFWRFSDDEGLLGFGGIEGSGEERLLRSVVISADRRGNGAGQKIVAAIEAAAVGDGVQRLHLLTTSAASFFHAIGYQDADRGRVPPEIASTAQFASLCPASATYLVKDLG